MKEKIYKLNSLTRKRNVAREKLYQVMIDNEDEWKQIRSIQKIYENKFVILWEKYGIDSKFVEKEFFECCKYLVEFIKEERITDRRFKKIYKPYYDKFQKLNKEYTQMKLQQSKKKLNKNKEVKF